MNIIRDKKNKIQSRNIQTITKTQPIIEKSDGVPVGTIITYATIEPPRKYLVCNGASVSRTKYIDLYNIIGTRFGNGDGSTTFNLPDFTDKFILGSNIENQIGVTGGAFSKVLQVSQLPAHSHTGTVDSAGTHNHSITDNGHSHAITDPGHNHSITDPGHSHTMNNNRTVLTTGNNTRIDVDSSPNELDLDESTFASINNNTTGISINTANSGISVNSANTNISINNNGAHVHTFTSTTTGNGSPIDITNPFVKMAYLIKWKL
jgi:microcystin-dependent protein